MLFICLLRRLGFETFVRDVVLDIFMRLLSLALAFGANVDRLIRFLSWYDYGRLDHLICYLSFNRGYLAGPERLN